MPKVIYKNEGKWHEHEFEGINHYQAFGNSRREQVKALVQKLLPIHYVRQGSGCTPIMRDPEETVDSIVDEIMKIIG